jgi:hypothetical protein
VSLYTANTTYLVTLLSSNDVSDVKVGGDALGALSELSQATVAGRLFLSALKVSSTPHTSLHSLVVMLVISYEVWWRGSDRI